jgi:hypothetical protein
MMAEGRSNAGIGQVLYVTEGTVEKHVRSIFMKLQLSDTAEAHHRVLAVLAFLISTDAREDYADLVAESPAAGFVAKAELSAAAIYRILSPQ